MEERCSRQGVADVSAGTVKASLRSHCTVAFARGRRAREGRWGEGRGGKRGKAQLGSSSFIGDRESRDKELKICFANSELDAPQRTKPPGWPLLRAPWRAGRDLFTSRLGIFGGGGADGEGLEGLAGIAADGAVTMKVALSGSTASTVQ